MPTIMANRFYSWLARAGANEKMAEKVMVLMDSFSVRSEAVQYSIELAGRMGYSLLMLVILPLDSEELSGSEDFRRRAENALLSHLSAARESGIDAEAEVRSGDPGTLVAYAVRQEWNETQRFDGHSCYLGPKYTRGGKDSVSWGKEGCDDPKRDHFPDQTI